jgi:ankyrin repeat protein
MSYYNVVDLFAIWYKHTPRCACTHYVSLAPAPGALQKAAADGDAAAVARLLAAGADVDAADSASETAQWKASYKGHLAAAEVLLESEAHANKASADGRRINTPLIAAAVKGHAEVVARLLAGWVDVDAASSTGETALWRASHQGHLAVVELLLDAGADAKKSRHRRRQGMANGATPLIAAAQ